MAFQVTAVMHEGCVVTFQNETLLRIQEEKQAVLYDAASIPSYMRGLMNALHRSALTDVRAEILYFGQPELPLALAEAFCSYGCSTITAEPVVCRLQPQLAHVKEQEYWNICGKQYAVTPLYQKLPELRLMKQVKQPHRTVTVRELLGSAPAPAANVSLAALYAAFGLRGTERTHFSIVTAAAIALTYSKMEEAGRTQVKEKRELLRFAKQLTGGTVTYRLLEEMLGLQKEFKKRAGVDDAKLHWCLGQLLLNSLEDPETLAAFWEEIRRKQLFVIWKEVLQRYEDHA